MQGQDMKEELSRAWSQDVPRAAVDGISDIDVLKNSCTHAQYGRRDKAFDDALRFVKNAHPQGVMPPVSQSFKNWNLPRQFKDARVDLEVKAGLAFI